MSTTREQFIAGLRELADFLDGNPLVPAPLWPSITNPSTVSADEVRAVAEIVGVDADGDDDGHTSVTLTFGGLEYRIVHVSRNAMAKYNAVMSYSGLVTP